MKNFVDLKNYLTSEIKPQENYQYFIFKELLQSNGVISYDEISQKYQARYDKKYKTDIKSIFKNTPTKVLTKHGYISSDKKNIYSEILETPPYYKKSILWILDKCLEHWDENENFRNLELREGIPKTIEEIDIFCSENNVPNELVLEIIKSINRDEKQIILDGPPGTGKTYLLKKIINFLGNEESTSELVQFHPSYGYEEFIEGLRPTTKEGRLKFQVVPGILKELIQNSKSSFPISITNAAEANSTHDLNNKLSNKYYFVAQGGSYEVAKLGKNIWAPNKNARGAEQVDWNLLTKLNIGDLIIHYSSNHIRAIGKVVDSPVKDTKRPYLGDDLKNRDNTTYLSWENNEETLGTLVEVDYFELKNPINKDEFCGAQTIYENKITKNSAFDKNGNISQKYLSSLSSNFMNFLEERFDEVSELLEQNFKTSALDILEGFSAPEVLTSIRINELPESPGVHLIYHEDTLLYVGETGNTRRRITEHMRSHHASGDTFINHSQKKFGLDLAKDEDKSKFDQLRSNMTIIYKLTEEKEALKNKLIDELKPEYNQKLASVNLSELNEDTKNSEHILLRFNPEWRDPASGTVMGVREYHQDVIDKNNYVWWGKYYVSRRIINSNKVQIYKEQLKNGVSTYVYFLENRPGVKMYKSKLLDITEDFSEVEKQLIPKYYRDVAEDDCEVYFKIDKFEEVDRTQTIDSLRKASDPTKVDGVKIALTGSSSYLSVNIPYNEVTTEESSEKNSKTHDIEHKQIFEYFGSYDFLLIDEINRGNLPKIFGELLNAFEYRDENIGLQYSEKPLSVPSNLIFLGSMNSTDKSVGRIDAALRRRFDFIHVPPNYDVLDNYYQIMENRVPNLISGLKKLNDELEKKHGKHCLVGHTFFMKKNSEPFTYDDLGKIWDRKIYPLLVEYFLDEPSELEIFNSVHNFWPVELENNIINNKKKYKLEILSNDLEKINPKLKNEFNKIINWSKKYKEFDIYLGRREDPSFTTGGGMFIYKKNSETEGNKKRENYYHLFRITGKGKFEFRLKDLYESKYTRAPFNKQNFRNEFEEKLKILFQTHNIEIKDNFFNTSQPGISFEDLVVNNGVDQMLNVWEWVIENINKASPND